MRDLIWTVIVIWLVWKIYQSFAILAKGRRQDSDLKNNVYDYNKNREGKVTLDKKESDRKTHFKPDDGEYVDYEEIK